VKAGAGKSAVFDAVKWVNATLRRMPGFVEHEIAAGRVDGDDRWIDIVHWRDRESAAVAESKFRAATTDPSLAAALELRWVRVCSMNAPLPCEAIPLAS
jgi:hypothetical protein